MPSDVFWAAAVAGATGLASNVPTYLAARFGHRVQLASIEAENQRLLAEHRQLERREGAIQQRETLIELQDWLAKLARASGAIHHGDEMRYRETGKWGRERVGEELNLAHHEATVNVNRFRVRVLDEAIREASGRFVALAADVSMGAMREQTDADARDRAGRATQALTKLWTTLNEQIGEGIRAQA